MCGTSSKKQGVRCQLGRKSYSFLLSPWCDEFSKQTNKHCWTPRKYVFDVTPFSVGCHGHVNSGKVEIEFPLEGELRFPCAQVMVRQMQWNNLPLQSWPNLCGTSLPNALPRPSVSFSHGNKRSLGQILPPPPFSLPPPPSPFLPLPPCNVVRKERLAEESSNIASGGKGGAGEYCSNSGKRHSVPHILARIVGTFRGQVSSFLAKFQRLTNVKSDLHSSFCAITANSNSRWTAR